MLGRIEGRGTGHQKMRWLDGITDAKDMNLGIWKFLVQLLMKPNLEDFEQDV